MKTDIMKVRVGEGEKHAFEEAAALAGISLSAWIRERLRRAARIELADVGKRAQFLTEAALVQ